MVTYQVDFFDNFASSWNKILIITDLEMSQTQKHFTVPLKIAISIVILCRVFILLRVYQYLGLERMDTVFWANSLQALSIASVLILYPIRFYKKPQKMAEDYLKVLLVEFYSLFSISNIYHLPQAEILSYLAIGSCLSWIILGLFNSMKVKSADEKSVFMALPTQLGSFSIAVFGIGMILRIQHYPYGDLVVLTGTFLLIAWIFEAEWRGKIED